MSAEKRNPAALLRARGFNSRSTAVQIEGRDNRAPGWRQRAFLGAPDLCTAPCIAGLCASYSANSETTSWPTILH
jgi:hypothetical protein